jgi:hypothetical protein
MWMHNGQLHRDDGPAYERLDGTQRYYQHGLLHREDGPAIIHSDGTCLWFRQGVLSREDGPPVIFGDGTREWFWETSSHREVSEEDYYRRLPEPDPLQIEQMLEVIAGFGFQEA